MRATPRAHACLRPCVVVPCADTAPAAGARPSPACCVEEDQMVQIVPHFTFQDVHFLSGRYGPFQVMGWACVCVAAASASFPPRARAGCLLSVTVDNTRDTQCTHTHLHTHSRGHGRVRHAPGQAKIPTEVPLWLALQLKQRQLCTIRYGACVYVFGLCLDCVRSEMNCSSSCEIYTGYRLCMHSARATFPYMCFHACVCICMHCMCMHVYACVFIQHSRRFPYVYPCGFMHVYACVCIACVCMYVHVYALHVYALHVYACVCI
jgi:hypothetical protein